MPHLLQQLLAAALELPPDQVRVVTPHVGGGFGGKAGLYPEQTVVAQAALRARPPGHVDGDAQRGHGRAVRTAGRRSSTSSSAASATARSPGCACASSATPAPIPGIGAFLPAGTRRMSNGTYRFPAIQFDVVVAATNTTPTGAYRGAGRPGGDGAARARRRPRRARARHRPDRARASATCSADDVFPFLTLTGRHLRQRPVHRAARRGRPPRRLRRAARASRPRAATAATARCSASASPPTSRSRPAAAPASTARSRCTTTARRRSSPARRRTARATRRRSR